MEAHKEQHRKSIRFFNDREVRAVWDDEHNKWWFSVLDIIAAINEQDDYQKTRNYWKYLKTKLRKENSQLVSATNQLKLKASDGKSYKTDTFDAEGVTLLAKHINNTKATNFLDWFLYSDNTIDGQSKKKPINFLRVASCKRQNLAVLSVCNRSMLIFLVDYMTLRDKFVPRIYPKEVLLSLIVCTSLKPCKQ